MTKNDRKHIIRRNSPHCKKFKGNSQNLPECRDHQGAREWNILSYTYVDFPILLLEHLTETFLLVHNDHVYVDLTLSAETMKTSKLQQTTH